MYRYILNITETGHGGDNIIQGYWHVWSPSQCYKYY